MYDPFPGFPLVEDPSLVEHGPPKVVHRTIWERFFERPWRPWQGSKVVATTKPSMGVRYINGRLHAHPEVIKEIKERLRERRKEEATQS